MTRVLLSRPDPGDDGRRPYRHDDLPPWEDEVERAGREALRWVEQWLTPGQVAAWLAAWPGAQPDTVAGFVRAGVTPDVATTRLWYGKVNPGRPQLAVRVAAGELTLDEALAQLRDAGLVEPAADVR